VNIDAMTTIASATGPERPPAASAPPPPSFAEVARSLRALRDHALLTERALTDEVALVVPEERESARNLCHYLALRQHDVRGLQASLARLGLSSLGRSEPHVLASLDAVLSAAERLGEGAAGPAREGAPPVDHVSGPAHLARSAARLLGPAPAGRDVRVMVTMPSEAAYDPSLVRALLEAGMDVMRVNCAHDDPSAWEAMVENLARARESSGRACRVLFDLAGPKIRTGPIGAPPRAIHVRPERDDRGVETTPARLWVTATEAPAPPPLEGEEEEDATGPAALEGALGKRLRRALPAPPDAVLGIDAAILAACRPGDRLRVVDTRGRKRKLLVVSNPSQGGVRAALEDGAWLEPGLSVEHRRLGTTLASGRLSLPLGRDDALLLRPGDRLRLVPPGVPGAPAGEGGAPPRVPCTCAEAVRDARPGERAFFDDGKAGALVEESGPDGLLLRVTSAPPGGLKLRADKGINLPDTAIALPALTPKDMADLAHAVRLADMVGLSFVRGPDDVALLVHELEARGAPGMGIVLKIETRAAFERLPRLLLAALRSPPVGVMVARGDLAVECGFERLAEVQEEILWLCEAAHVPVIWATQVLEGLAKTGQPSRAEVTDAAMGGRAECVMLNKGPHVADAVRFLDDVLRRMRAHQQKKRSMLRRLSVSDVEPWNGRAGAPSGET
jgi:pyruvate kinase